jgi:hypothetical protein
MAHWEGPAQINTETAIVSTVDYKKLMSWMNVNRRSSQIILQGGSVNLDVSHWVAETADFLCLG